MPEACGLCFHWALRRALDTLDSALTVAGWGALALLGWALIANYLAPYGVVALGTVTIYGVVLLEEKELRDRFGKEYEDYCRCVPRFFPGRT